MGHDSLVYAISLDSTSTTVSLRTDSGSSRQPSWDLRRAPPIPSFNAQVELTYRHVQLYSPTSSAPATPSHGATATGEQGARRKVSLILSVGRRIYESSRILAPVCNYALERPGMSGGLSASSRTTADSHEVAC